MVTTNVKQGSKNGDQKECGSSLQHFLKLMPRAPRNPLIDSKFHAVIAVSQS